MPAPLAPPAPDTGSPGAGSPDATTGPLLAAVCDLAPTLAARAEEVEARRRLPLDLLDELRSAGCFRMSLPRSHGGEELDLVTSMQVLEELARADGSVAWVVAIGASGWLDLVGLPRDTFDALYADGPLVTAGVFAPSGIAQPVDGGYRIGGRWAFASGCEHADLLYGNCIDAGAEVGADGQGAAGGEGPPPMRIAVFAPDQVTIEDTWHVSGLCGTGSHHIVVDDLVVPAERTFAVLTAEPCVDAVMARIPLPAPYALLLAGIALGIARGALDDLLGLAAGKVPLLAAAELARSPHLHLALGEADARLRAAQATVHDEARALWRAAEAGDPIEVDQRARLRASSTWATTTAAAVVDTAYTAGGGTSLYASSPLQRRLRDIHAVTQHFLVRPDTMTAAGAVLAGQEPTVPFL